MTASKFNMGITLSKQDSSGNFKPIFVKENTTYVNVNGVPILITTYIQTPDCNLK